MSIFGLDVLVDTKYSFYLVKLRKPLMKNNELISKLSFFVTRHPWWVIFFSFLLVVGLALGVKNLEFKSDYRVYFSEDNPELLAFEAIQNTYSKSDNILFVIQPKSKNVFTPHVLQAIIELTEKSWQIPFSSRVDSITNFQHTVAEKDDLVVADLVSDTALLTGADLQRIKQIAINDMVGVKKLSVKFSRTISNCPTELAIISSIH